MTQPGWLGQGLLGVLVLAVAAGSAPAMAVAAGSVLGSATSAGRWLAVALLRVVELVAQRWPVVGLVDSAVVAVTFPPSRHPYSAAGGGVGGGSVGNGGGVANSVCSAGTVLAAAQPAIPVVHTWL